MNAPLAEMQAALVANLVTSTSGVFPATSNITTPATPVATPLVPYTPTSGTAYLDVRPLLQAQPEQPYIEFDSATIHRGIFQVDVVVPDQKGEAPGLRLAKLVADRFAIGTMLTVSSYRLKILKPPAIAAAIKGESGWVRYPVSIPYFLAVG